MPVDRRPSAMKLPGLDVLRVVPERHQLPQANIPQTLVEREELRSVIENCGRRSGGAPVESGYFVCSSGNTDETIAEYIRLQGAEPQDDDRFRVSEE